MSTLPQGFLAPWSTWGKFNQIEFVIDQLLKRVQTATLVKVLSCTNNGSLSAIGTVNVQPAVNQVDSAGNAYPHSVVYDVPYFRLGNASGSGIILDPKVGDIGICLFASRDLTSVIANQAPANPGSSRQFDYSDALYIGLALSQVAPSQYIQFSDTGISIVSPTEITIKAPTINLEGDVRQINGTMTAQTDVLAGANAISLVNHTHTSETPGTPTSPPLP